MKHILIIEDDVQAQYILASLIYKTYMKKRYPDVEVRSSDITGVKASPTKQMDEYTFQEYSIQFTTVTHAVPAIELLAHHDYDMILLDCNLACGSSGKEVVAYLMDHAPDTFQRIIVESDNRDFQQIVEAVGITKFMVKNPRVIPDEIMELIY